MSFWNAFAFLRWQGCSRQELQIVRRVLEKTMKIKVTRPVEIDVKYVRIVAAVRYDEEDIPNDFPGRRGDVWEVTVDIETGKILDWPGPAFDVHMKVCDQGSYYLLDAEQKVLAAIEDNYVPNDLVPGSYGDYIEMNIAEDGTVTNWPKLPDVDEFFPRD